MSWKLSLFFIVASMLFGIFFPTIGTFLFAIGWFFIIIQFVWYSEFSIITKLMLIFLGEGIYVFYAFPRRYGVFMLVVAMILMLVNLFMYLFLKKDH